MLVFNPVSAAEAKEACGVPVADSALSEGALIGDIVFDRRQVFDTSLPDEDKWLYRLANRYHVLTRTATIRDQLLLKPGDRYSARLVAETERGLRNRNYLYDASIVPVRPAAGQVDLCVTTRDVWTLLPGISLERAGGEDEVSIQLEELNLRGTGVAVGIEYEEDVERDSLQFWYSDRQLGSSRVAMNVSYQDNSDGDSVAFALQRPFFALDTRWSAGGDVLVDDRVRPLYDRGTTKAEFRQQRELLRVTGGRSAGLVDGWVRRWTVGMVYDDSRFGPGDTPALAGPVPADRRFVYPFVGFDLIEDRFDTTKNQDQMGRVEDLFLGTRLSASLGWSGSTFGGDDAALFDVRWSTGVGVSEKALWRLRAGLQGRYENSSLGNAIFSTAVRFTRRHTKRRMFYAALAADAGRRLDIDNPLRLGGESGLRGYPLAYQNGESRALVTLEERYFTDWYPLRLFRVGAAVFVDAGRVWGRSAVSGPGQGWLADAGFGLRLSPTRGGFGKVLHIDIAFPLNGDDSIDSVQLLLEGRRSF
ncbi:MAG: hypothetical protein HKN06_11685 [Gammaproteobacteria bacterium]|nr:hypothetical protein [Gammaproteobacteria bacterium]